MNDAPNLRAGHRTDVFIRVWAPNEIRLGMSIASIARWELEPDINLSLIVCEDSLLYAGWDKHLKVILPARNFAKFSIQMAETMSQGDIYCGADDDMLIYGKGFVARGLDLLRRHPDYGLIVASPTNEGVYRPVEPNGHLPAIVESHAVGGPGFMRKGLLTEFPPISNNDYAGYIHQQLLKKGQKSGYITGMRYLHMGSRYSISEPGQNDGFGGYVNQQEEDLKCQPMTEGMRS